MKRVDQLNRNFACKKPLRLDGMMWLEAHDRRLEIRGLAWDKENHKQINRLPLRVKTVVRPPVWELARCPAGARICFATNTEKLMVRVTSADGFTQVPHMPMTGMSGLALYEGSPHRMHPWSVAIPEAGQKKYERVLFEGVERRMREFTLYLPLYNPVDTLELGFSKGARFMRIAAPVLEKPVVFYGSSITQGGCASIPGSDYVSMLGRLLNLDLVNLGFSGNGICEPEVAELVAEIDSALVVFCSLTNTPLAELPVKLPAFYKIVRKRRPDTPILLLSRTSLSASCYSQTVLRNQEISRDIMIHFYSRQRLAGDGNIHFVDGESLIPFGVGGAHVDGNHPGDHGFRMMAERLAPFIEKILLADALRGKGGRGYPVPSAHDAMPRLRTLSVQQGRKVKKGGR